MIPREWIEGLRDSGFVFAEAPGMRAALAESPADWMRLSCVWRHAWADDMLAARSAMDDLRRAIPHLSIGLVDRTLKGLHPDWLERLVAAGLPA